MVMELLGPSLEEFFDFCSRRFSLKTVLLLADQMISCIEHIHSQNYVHRNIKPNNFRMGLSRPKQVYIIDFGIAKEYKDEASVHIPCTESKTFIGTFRYSSINALLNTELSRRDDLESLGYVLIYFLAGKLPWQGLKSKRHYQKYVDKKISTPIEILCKDFPAEFSMYIKYCRDLEFDQDPDYDYLRQLFRTLYHNQGYTHDSLFDWSLFNIESLEDQQEQDKD